MFTRRIGPFHVAPIGMGCMNFNHAYGTPPPPEQAQRLLLQALDAGVTLFDTAALYGFGANETLVGRVLKPHRSRIVLCSKGGMAGEPQADGSLQRVIDGRPASIRRHCEASLQRLQTDHIDLYQLHWPDRSTNTFGQLGFSHIKDEETTPIEESLAALQELVQAGKIRHVAVSNETPWGLSRFLHLAEARALPRVATIQNPYSLLNRSFEIGLAEMSLREDVGLLAYSPLGFGVLSGKYLAGQRPEGGRLSLFERFSRYSNDNAERATYEYVSLFRRHGIDPAQGALAFVNRQAFVTSNIIGATTLAQLRSNIDSLKVSLPPEVLDGIEAIHQRYPNPAP